MDEVHRGRCVRNKGHNSDTRETCETVQGGKAGVGERAEERRGHQAAVEAGGGEAREEGKTPGKGLGLWTAMSQAVPAGAAPAQL